jgi:hypothetical protein
MGLAGGGGGGVPLDGNFVQSGALAPQPARVPADGVPSQMFGDVWEWTASAYLPYPRFRPLGLTFDRPSCGTPIAAIPLGRRMRRSPKEAKPT